MTDPAPWPTPSVMQARSFVVGVSCPRCRRRLTHAPLTLFGRPAYMAASLRRVALSTLRDRLTVHEPKCPARDKG